MYELKDVSDLDTFLYPDIDEVDTRIVVDLENLYELAFAWAKSYMDKAEKYVTWEEVRESYFSKVTAILEMFNIDMEDFNEYQKYNSKD